MGAAGSAIQLTKGLEEEVYTGTREGDIVGLSHRIAADLRHFATEPDSRNVEFTTEPFRDYEILISRLMTRRCRLRRYLRELGDYTLIPGGTLSLGGMGEFQLSNPNNPYYRFIRDSYGTDVVTASSHLNIGVEDNEELLRACRVVRCEASMFLALTASSPFLNGEVTGLHSTRWHIFPKTPESVPFFGDYSDFLAWAERQLATGTMQNPRHLWLSVRPNGPASPYELTRLELRICDRISCPKILKALVALLEASIWQVLEDPELDPLHDRDSDDLCALSLANEEAVSRCSLEARVRDWRSDRLIPAKDWIAARFEELQPVARRHDLVDHLSALPQLLEEGNLAQAWLDLVRRGRSPRSILREAVEAMADQDVEVMGTECA